MSNKKKDILKRIQEKPLFGINFRGRPPWDKDGKLTFDDFIDQPVIGLDFHPVDFDPFPKLTKAIERGGLKAGFKYIKKKLRRKKK